MDSNSDYYSAPATILHDVLHEMGLGDRYSENKKGNVNAAEGYNNDIMGFGAREAYLNNNIEVKQTHFDNYGNTLFQPKESNIVSKQRVDKATIKNPLEKWETL